MARLFKGRLLSSWGRGRALWGKRGITALFRGPEGPGGSDLLIWVTSCLYCYCMKMQVTQTPGHHREFASDTCPLFCDFLADLNLLRCSMEGAAQTCRRSPSRNFSFFFPVLIEYTRENLPLALWWNTIIFLHAAC